MEKNEEGTKKRSRGRQKIPIEKIANKSSLQVTFSKRRTGLFKKASELSTLCGAQVAVIVESPAGKIFSFGNPCVDSVIHRFETDQEDVTREKYMEVEALMGKGNCWWEDVCLENLGLQELEECMAAMQVFKNNLLKKDLGMANSSSHHPQSLQL